MNRFILWLEKEATWKNIFLWIFLAYFINFSYIFLIFIVSDIARVGSLADFVENLPVHYFILLCVFSWFLEEVVFRFIPIAASVRIFGKKYKIFIVLILVSGLFGFLHGGWSFIFFQGFCGLTLCLLYLKCGGLSTEYLKQSSFFDKTKFFFKKHSKALFASTVAHAMFNFSIYVVVYLYL